MKANYLLIGWIGALVAATGTVATSIVSRLPPAELPHQQLNIEAQVHLGVVGATTLGLVGTTTLGRERFGLEVARNADEWAIGLMGRKHLEAERGMLFWFTAPKKMRFWMRNTLISLDMLFIRDGHIVEVVRSAPPCRTETCPFYGPVEPISAVIELAGGTAARLGLRPGERVQIEWLSPQKKEQSWNR